MEKLTAVILFLFVSGCISDSTRGIVGPCVHIYKDPVLHIERVTNARTGGTIFAFKISAVHRERHEQNLFSLKKISYGVVLYDSVLFCNTPCGFGTDEGLYSLSVSATGFRDTVIQVSPRYSIFQGGCPSSNSGGTRISFALEPTHQ